MSVLQSNEQYRTREAKMWVEELAWQRETVGIEAMARIRREVAKKYGLTVPDILRRRRIKEITRARHEAMFRCYMETAASLPQIGRFFGGFDHSTVLSAIRAHRKREAKQA